MRQSLSSDLRDRVVAAVACGTSCRAAAARFGIAPSTAIKWVQRWRQTGSADAKRRGGDRKSSRLEVYAAEILELVDIKSAITLAEIAAHMKDRYGLSVAPSTVWRLLDRHRITFKKNRARQRTTTA